MSYKRQAWKLLAKVFKICKCDAVLLWRLPTHGNEMIKSWINRQSTHHKSNLFCSATLCPSSFWCRNPGYCSEGLKNITQWSQRAGTEAFKYCGQFWAKSEKEKILTIVKGLQWQPYNIWLGLSLLFDA